MSYCPFNMRCVPLCVSLQAPTSGPPPLPSSSLPEGYYEEAVPLSPGKAPEYITSNYDSDAMSSSYESYDEEEEGGRKARHQWPSEEASMHLVKDARICAFLLRKKRFGQWTKLLCVIKDNKLLCYKSSKDHAPQMELSLSGCSISHVPKDGKKKKHELRIVHQGTDALVLAVQSQEQAEQWLKVSAPQPHAVSCDRPGSDGELPHENGHGGDCKDAGKGKKAGKTEQKSGTLGKGASKKITKIIGLGKKKPSEEQTSSAEEEVPTCGYLNVLSNSRWRERWCRLKENQLLLHKDRDDLRSHMASLPLRGCEVSPGLDQKHPFAFRLLRNGQEVAVLEASSSEALGRWLGVLLAETGSTTDPAALHYDYIDVETTANVIQLAKQSFCFTSKRAVSPNPYLDNPVNGGYSRPSGVALHYDDVPINGMVRHTTNAGHSHQNELYENTELYENMPSPALAARFPAKPSSASSSTKKPKPPAAKVTSKFLSADAKSKDTAQVSVDQYKYGKNRVEADAKRLQAKDDELARRKQEIRNRLTQLKKERRDLRSAVEAAAGKRTLASLTERLKKVEDECKQKEEERVTLELEMTEVQESLKKALSGGVTLGLTIEPKSGSSTPQSPVAVRRTLESSPFSSCDTSDTESLCLPVNSASLLRRHPAGQKVPPVRGHVLRKAKEWEMKTGT
uniref:Actin filament associated protein 1 n=1 Tax=Gadus morhua TaxID=8049 RepID=A0A8C5FFM4_GADMO